MKFLLWFVIGAVAVAWLMRGKKLPPQQADRRPPSGHGATEPMLQCAHCGVHIPASEAVLDSTHAVFCCDAHRLKHSTH